MDSVQSDLPWTGDKANEIMNEVRCSKATKKSSHQTHR